MSELNAFRIIQGDAVVTKYAELVVFPDTDFEVCAVHIPIRFCPFCSRPMK